MRYRHFDNDLVRAARQQSFLGDAKSQIGVSGVFDDREQLLRIFARSVRTDIRSSRRDPAACSSWWPSLRASPIQEVQFPAQDSGDGSGSVEISRTALRRTVRRFVDVRGSRGARGTTSSHAAQAARRASRGELGQLLEQVAAAVVVLDRPGPGGQPPRGRGRGGAAAGQALAAGRVLPAPDGHRRSLSLRRHARL